MPGTAIFEIGFRSGFARHYASAAAGLGLDYSLVEVEPDPLDRGISADVVSLPEPTLVTLPTLVRAKLLRHDPAEL